MKNKQKERFRGCEFGESGECGDSGEALAKLELALANFQGFDLVFKRRGRNLKLGSSSGWPRDTAPACDQRGLNDLSLSRRLALRRRRSCNNARDHLRRFVGEPHIV